MTDVSVRRPRATPQAAALLLVAAGGWALTVPRALDMGSTPGTMGLSLAAFLVMWSLMMAAMMLPAIASVTGLYVRTFTDRPWVRTAQLAGGYLLAWAAAGVPLFLLARVADHAPDGSLWPRWLAAAIFATAGGWQLSGAKDRCLRHCRSPLGLLLHYGSYRGRGRDLRVGLHHAAWCLGCCWALMVLFVAFGVMNLGAMVGLAALVVAEKRWSAGERLSRVAGFALLGLAVTVLFVPSVAPGLAGGHSHMGHMGGMGHGPPVASEPRSDPRQTVLERRAGELHAHNVDHRTSGGRRTPSRVRAAPGRIAAALLSSVRSA